ncbi:dipeptidase [Hypericibacter terrae]|jgi:Xaa-Pro aminopeptidase|uniref:Dipeptidase n=1 Tax=Hypericibacter terrae TaxID=2602015 RepID=A0A5J6MIK2_9PROT|nr:Xaa-Pro peptidase family protein [Hypericibacter terrae]QEX17274.1 dipeptidase [Hypericibacter terrae]
MTNVFQQRTTELQRRMADERIDAFLLADPDSIFFFSGCFGYLGMEWDRATLLLVPRSGAPTLVTPLMESELMHNQTWVEDIRDWVDGVDGEWMKHVDAFFATHKSRRIMFENHKTPPKVTEALRHAAGGAELVEGSQLISKMRMIKSPEEIAIMRQAGQVAVAMGKAGKAAIAEGVPEYEVALAVIAGGTRKAAELLQNSDAAEYVSPTIYNLQIMQSGRHTCMVHRRSTVKRIAKGDPVYLCFCGIANFRHFKLGFDREFFVGSVTDEQAKTYETTVKAQQAALALVKPGAVAEDVNAAAEEVYRSAGFGLSYRTGRGIGYSFLEDPQLKKGDKTKLQAGMAFAVDGGITVKGRYGTRIGDSIIVTEKGFDYLTEFPRGLTVL